MRRSFRAASGLPKCMRQRRDFSMSEGCGVVYRYRLSDLVRQFRMFEGLPGVLVPSLMILFALLFTGAVGVGGYIVQFGSPLMIFVMGSVVVSSGHLLETQDLPGFRMGFSGKLIGAIRIFKGAFRMPVTGLILAFFAVFGRGPMGMSGKLVLFRGSTMGFVHSVVFCGWKRRRLQTWGTGLRGPRRASENRNYSRWGDWLVSAWRNFSAAGGVLRLPVNI